MESRNGRSWVARVGVAALFVVVAALGSCDIDAPMGVGPEQTHAPQKVQVSANADSTSNSTEDDCYWVNGQWICP